MALFGTQPEAAIGPGSPDKALALSGHHHHVGIAARDTHNLKAQQRLHNPGRVAVLQVPMPETPLRAGAKGHQDPAVRQARREGVATGQHLMF